MKKLQLVIAVMAALFFAWFTISLVAGAIDKGGITPMTIVSTLLLALLPALATVSIVKALIEKIREERSRI